MYDSVMINSFGDDIFTNIGALKNIKDKLVKVNHWNVVGNSSLILFLKVLGYDYDKTFNIISEFKLLSYTLNLNNLMIDDQDRKLSLLRSWLESHIQKTKIFNENVTLEDVFKLTKINTCFLVWEKENKKIININSETYPKIKFLDAVLVSLTCVGMYSSYILEKRIYSNLISIDSFPYKHAVKDKSILYIFSSVEYSDQEESLLETNPFGELEREAISQQYNRNNIFLNYIKENIKDNLLVTYSQINKKNLNSKEKKNLFNIGYKQIDFHKNKD